MPRAIWAGVRPRNRFSERVMWGWSKYPSWSTVSSTGVPRSSKVAAVRARAICRIMVGLRPVARAKWYWIARALNERCASDTIGSASSAPALSRRRAVSHQVRAGPVREGQVEHVHVVDRIEAALRQERHVLAVHSEHRVVVDEAVVEMEQAEQVDEIALEETPGAQVLDLTRSEAQVAQCPDLVADLAQALEAR